MIRCAIPRLPRAVDGPMGAPQRFLGDSVRYNGKKVEIALYLAVFVTRDREGYVVGYIYIVITIYVSLNYSPRLKIRLHNQGYTSGCSLENFIRARIKFVGGCGIWSKLA